MLAHMSSRTLPGWFVHFLIDLSKNKQARVPFYKPQDCILDAYMYLLLKECRPYVLVSNVMASIRREKIRYEQNATRCPFDQWWVAEGQKIFGQC